MDKKTRPTYMLPLRDPPQIERHTLTKGKGVENILMQMERKKKSWALVLISNIIDFKTKAIVRDKEGHYIMVTNQQEDITLVNIYVPNLRTPKYVKKTLMDIKGEIDRNTVIVGDFNNSLTNV